MHTIILSMIVNVLTHFYIFLLFSKLEEASVQPTRKDKLSSPQPQLRIHELRAEKYNGLVRLLKPGCRTIILLVDAQSRLKLLPIFHKAVWPYRYVASHIFSCNRQKEIFCNCVKIHENLFGILKHFKQNNIKTKLN